MKALQGTTRSAFLGFFASHILFTVLLDGQALFGDSYPQVLRELLTWYTTTFNDPLMSVPPRELMWFHTIIACELIFQLPFFVVACHFLRESDITHYPDWFRCSCIAYAGHAVTQMAPILTFLVSNKNATVNGKALILCVYLPYLIFPVWFLYICVTSNEDNIVGTKKKTD